MKQFNNSIFVSAPGKIHLLGEHSVSYGKPALLSAIDKRITVEVARQKSNSILLFFGNTSKQISYSDILEVMNNAQALWIDFQKTHDITKLKSLTSDIFNYISLCIGEASLFWKEEIDGVKITITSNLPIGSGLGSSASLAVAIAGALTHFLNKKATNETIWKIAYECEQKAHGNSSGGDVAAVVFGKLIYFQSLSEHDKVIKQLSFDIPENIEKNFYLLNTGRPNETTSEMVEKVRELFENNSSLREQFLVSQEDLTNKFVTALKQGMEQKILDIIKAGEENLEKIGVVSDFSHLLIREIEKGGGAAKICGAGGKKHSTGMILVYHTNFKTIAKIAKSQDVDLNTIKLNQEGLKIE